MKPLVAVPLDLVCLSDLSEAAALDWQDFLTNARHQHPRQDPRFASVARADGWEVCHVIGRDRVGKIRATGLFSMRRHPVLPGAFAEARCLSGPVCDDAAVMVTFLDGVLNLPAFARVGRVKVTPYWVQQEAGIMADALSAHGWKIAEADAFRQTGHVDITPPVSAIMESFSKSARREVRRAERQNITVRPVLDDAGALEFLDSLNRLRKARRIGAIARPGYMAAFQHMYKDGDLGIILGAYHGGVFVAGLQLYRGRFTAHGRQFTTETARLHALGNLRIAPLLWLKGMEWAQSKGCTALDVEGWRENVDPTEKKYNLYKYKSGFSPRAIQRISERSKVANRLVDVTGNLKNDLRTMVRDLLRGLLPRLA